MKRRMCRPDRVTTRPSLEPLEDRNLMSVAAGGSLTGGDTVYAIKWSGDLYEYQGSSPTLLAASTEHGGPVQVSAGIHGLFGAFSPESAAFVRFKDGTVKEYYHVGSTISQVKVWDPSSEGGKKISEISASQVTMDTVFMRSGGNVWEHVGTNPTIGLTLVAQPGFGPLASQISAGKDAATGKEAVFVNFGGILREHVGNDPTKGWSYLGITDVTNFCASQVQGDTVFVNEKGALREHIGKDPNSGWSAVLATNVKEVSAGVDSSGKAAAYVLFNTGKLYEHTGTAATSGWSYIADGVSSMDASEAKANTVFYETADGYMGWEHSGSSYSLIWDDIVK
jgi:hypothetical protein